MSYDRTDPANYWPGEGGISTAIPVSSVLVDAVYAVAAELRTANQIAFLTLRNHSTLTQKTLAPIAARVGLDH